MGLMYAAPLAIPITPAFWYYLTATLLTVLILHRFKANINGTLAIKSTELKWLLIAMIIGVSYWWIDHWLSAEVFAIDTKQSIAHWRQANQNFLAVTVLFSSVLLAPMLEELVFRGLLFRSLLRHMNGWLAASISALLFAAIHWSWPAFINLFIVGLLYAWLTIKSNSLWPAFIAHVIHNGLTYWVYSQTVIA